MTTTKLTHEPSSDSLPNGFGNCCVTFHVGSSFPDKLKTKDWEDFDAVMRETAAHPSQEGISQGVWRARPRHDDGPVASEEVMHHWASAAKVVGKDKAKDSGMFTGVILYRGNETVGEEQIWIDRMGRK